MGKRAVLNHAPCRTGTKRRTIHNEGPHSARNPPLGNGHPQLAGHQNSSLSTFAGKAFTTVFAGFALTNTTFPNISLFPAFVAGFWRVLIITKPGTTNLPFIFVCSVAMLARVLRTLPATCFFSSQLSAIAAVRAPLVMAVPFIIGAMSPRQGSSGAVA